MKNTDDINFLRNSVKEDISLPESLSKESIVSLITEEKQNKTKKGTLRRFVPVAVAACVMIALSLAFFGGGFSLPNATENEKAEDVQNISQSVTQTHKDIIDEIREYASTYSKNRYYYYTIDESVEGSAFGTTADTTINSGADLSVSKNFSDVNLREKNVLEADIFITDGEYLYFLDSFNRTIRIVKPMTDGKLSAISEIHSEDSNNFHYQGLYTYENYLIASFNMYKSEESSYKEKSGVRIYDISDKGSPVLIKEIVLDGRYISSRITDNKLILITDHSIVQYFEGFDDSHLIPEVYNGTECKKVPAEDITLVGGENPEGYVNIAIQNLGDLNSPCSTSSFLGSSYNIYCTKDTLYTMSCDYGQSVSSPLIDGVITGGVMLSVQNADTKITKIDISGEKAAYKATATVKGSILNDYSIDAFEGYLRIAVTREKENCILVLDENLETAGTLSGIAPGEQIKSARFMGNYAYVVTFRQTDPLFVIDLSKPESPEIKGEVKLPGFSSYLHPVGEGLLAGIGYGGTEEGVDGSGKISLFDVSQPSEPKEIDSLVFPDMQLGTHPKNFCSISEGSFLVTFEKWTDEFVDADEYRGWREYTGALNVSVRDNRLNLENAYIALSAAPACRSAFIDNSVYIYGISSGIASFDRQTGKYTDALGSYDDIFLFTNVNKPYEDILF